ncbi:MAG: response regulator transcription factor [Flavobacteriales bacterium]|nr:response regulator transcription factor [Flavobacteriales bacterium]
MNTELPIPTDRVRMAVIDDHPAMRIGLISIVDKWEKGLALLEAENGEDYEKKVANVGPIDIAIVDLSMPIRDGFATLEWMRANQPSTKALVLSFDVTPAAVRKAFRAGACGLLDKTANLAEYHHAFDSILSFGSYTSEQNRNMLLEAEPLPDPSERPHARILSALCPRELEFLRQACAPDDPSLLVIAQRMGITRNTAEGYRKSVYSTFGVSSRQGLFRAGKQWNLL